MAEQKNIIVGAASFYVGSSTAALDIDPAVARIENPYEAMKAAAVSAVWTDVGYTQEGVEVSYEPDFGEVEVDQLLDSAKIFKQSMRVTVNTTLAEATLENLLIVWGQGDATLATVGDDDVLEIVPGELGEQPNERGLVFIGPAPKRAAAQFDRVYHVTRAIQTESSSHALRRNEATSLPVSFRLLPDDTKPKSRYGTVRDRARVDTTPGG